jgi:hypothetical protein
VQIRRRLESGGSEFVVVLQPDGSFASLPAWMTEPAASRFEIGDEPHFPLHILRSMRAEVDALLGFLLSESKTETAYNGTQIRTSPTKPVQRGDAAREAVPGSQGRARGPSMTISDDRAAASLVQASNDCWPQSVTVASVRCLRSRLRVSPATAATGTHSSSSVDWSVPSSSRTECQSDLCRRLCIRTHDEPDQRGGRSQARSSWRTPADG